MHQIPKVLLLLISNIYQLQHTMEEYKQLGSRKTKKLQRNSQNSEARLD